MSDPKLLTWIGLAIVGFLVGGFGTLIGAGGGFILMPLLILLYPEESPEILASISLAVVFFNATSGSIGYAVQRRIAYRSGLAFSAAAVPGAIIGAFTTATLPRDVFDIILGVMLIAASAFLGYSSQRKNMDDEPTLDPDQTLHTHRVKYATERGTVISFFVGFVSSLLGIGGGIIHVPALVVMLRFPVHVATATSHFVLALTAAAGTGVHIANGTFIHGWRRTLALGIGVVIGAQIGARMARRTRPTFIIRGLAFALALAGLRIVYAALH